MDNGYKLNYSRELINDSRLDVTLSIARAINGYVQEHGTDVETPDAAGFNITNALILSDKIDEENKLGGEDLGTILEAGRIIAEQTLSQEGKYVEILSGNFHDENSELTPSYVFIYKNQETEYHLRYTPSLPKGKRVTWTEVIYL